MGVWGEHVYSMYTFYDNKSNICLMVKFYKINFRYFLVYCNNVLFLFQVIVFLAIYSVSWSIRIADSDRVVSAVRYC